MYPNKTAGWINVAAEAGLIESNFLFKDDLHREVSNFLYAGMYCPNYDEEKPSCHKMNITGHKIYLTDDAMKRKFLIAHIYGHMDQRINAGKIVGFYNEEVDKPEEWMCRCDYISSVTEEQAKCMQSREYFETALTEGFASFFAARTFNHKAGKDCFMASSEERAIPDDNNPFDPDEATIDYPPVTYDCAESVKWQNEWCETLDENTGVERDFMNFFWKWYVGGGTDPDGVKLWEIYEVIEFGDEATYTHETWEGLRESAEAFFDENPEDPRYLYFVDTAISYGIVQ